MSRRRPIRVPGHKLSVRWVVRDEYRWHLERIQRDRDTPEH